MAQFRYDPIYDDFISVKFRCTCGKENTTDSIEKPYGIGEHKTLAHKCCQCGKEYTIELYDDGVDGYGQINDVSDDAFISADGMLWEYYNNFDMSLLQNIDGKRDMKECIKTINAIDNHNVVSFINRLLLVNMFSIMDSYIHYVVLRKMEQEPIYLEVFCAKIFRKPAKSKSTEHAMRVLTRMSFQNTEKVVSFFHEVFDINLLGDGFLQKYVAYRNDIVHLNAVLKNGSKINVTQEELYEILEHVDDFCFQVRDALIDKKVDALMETKGE